jgi:tRNA-specific 2-thiouridylase
MPAERVAAALSGGVDSAVAALLLLEQGHDVFGVTMRLWREGHLEDDALSASRRDPTLGAQRVADALGIRLHIIDAAAPFKEHVVDRFIAEYSAGRTPNPCLYCNRQIKFGHLRERALALGASRLATGHYARLCWDAAREQWQLLKGVDRRKDQSYFLYVLGQVELSRALFPLGGWTKARVRALAAERALPAAHTEESQDLCFLSGGDYRRFLRQAAPQAFTPGPILDSSGRRIGQHRGLVEYTVGQRSGIGIATPQPLYVLRLDTEENALIVGTRDELGRDHLVAEEVNWVAGHPPRPAIAAEVKIRYRARPVAATVTPLTGDRADVRFVEALRDITPGQGAVFYQGEVVLGGGLITHHPRGETCS